MGRKKIEIRPLVDERNRNVTFLKRKAGLMKKAWELSVLCGADVSLMVFSANGKAFEFSSRDFDGELDRYLEYEGLIERRRADEFAAMAEAGEDDEDDDDDDAAARRKGSSSKAGKGAAAAPSEAGDKKPIKTLKGKEVYKVKQASRREITAAAESRRKRKDRDVKPSRGFIEGLVSDSDGDREDRDRSRESSDLANMNYAMSLGPSTAAAQTLASFPSSLPPQPYAQPSSSYYRSNNAGQMSPSFKNESNYSPAHYGHSQAAPSPAQPINYPPDMGGIQWDAALLQRYTEFQMQQNHQRQHRLLLQRQREQLALLGVGVGGESERRLLDDIFGAGGASGRAMSGGVGDGYQSSHGHGGSQHGNGNTEDRGFIWPTFGHPPPNLQSYPQQSHQQQQQTQPQPHAQRETSAFPSESGRHPYYPDDFDYDSHRQPQSQPHHNSSHSHAQPQTQNQSQSHPTPSSVSRSAPTPWYSSLGDLSGEPTRAGDELPYSTAADFEELIGRKRAGEELDGAGADKRVRVS